MEQQYTNELTPELAASLVRPPFPAEKKAGMSDGARQTAEGQEAFMREHPVVAVYRISVDGALEGDKVLYPGGTTARIVTGSGSKFQKSGQSIALVGSRLSNGDVIISAPQAGYMLNKLKGLPIDADFLPAEG